MNKGRKIKHSLMKNDINETTTTTNTKPKLLTPCRRVGLNRKRKNVLSGSCSSSELNISSPNTSHLEIDLSVKEHDSSPAVINKIDVDTPVLTKPRKNRLGASRKRSQILPKNDFMLSPEELKKYKICDVSVVLTRCDLDNNIINRDIEQPVDISLQIENEAISSTPELVETNPESVEIQTNQISTTIEDSTFAEHQSQNYKTPNKSVPNSKKIKDLFGDSDDSDFDFKRKKRKRFSSKPTDDSTQNSLNLDTGTQKNKTKSDENRKKKKTKKSEESKKKADSQNDSDEIPGLNTNSRKKIKRSSSHIKKSPKTSKLSSKSRLYNSDSDDDFMEKPRREKKDPDIKKKINIPITDPLNRIEHIRIRENKSYTIMHMNNISSYVKYYDNDVNLKRTESDDNQQTNSQPVVSAVRTSMILERKDYLSSKASQEINHNKPSDNVENSELLNPISICENPEISNETNDSTENDTENSNFIPNTENLDSNDIENPDSNDTLPDNIGYTSENHNLTNAENSKTVRYYERPDFDIPENQDFETPDNHSFATINNCNFETSNNNFEISDNRDFETTNDINLESNNKSNFEATDNSNIETRDNYDIASTDNPNFETRNKHNLETNNRNIETTDDSALETSDNHKFETSSNHYFESTSNKLNFETFNNQNFDVSDQSMAGLAENNDFDKTITNDGDKSDDTQNEMRKLLKLKSNLINQIKIKRDKLDSLKRIMAYKEEHNLADLTKTTLQFKYTLQEALVDLLSHLKTHTERNFNMLLLLGFLKIPSEMVGYNDETKSFE